MGQIVQHLVAAQKVAFAVGRIPAPCWLRVKNMGTSLWAAMIARLVAVYLPFVRGRAWVAIEDRVVTADLWNFYRHELRGRLADACFMLKRPDRAQMDNWLRLCVYSKKLSAFSQHEGQVSAVAEASLSLEYQWSPDNSGTEPVPIENIRCGLSLPDFVGNVMVSGSTHEAQRWRERLQGRVRKVDLTEFRL
jgi:hypothetical protein